MMRPTGLEQRAQAQLPRQVVTKKDRQCQRVDSRAAGVPASLVQIARPWPVRKQGVERQALQLAFMLLKVSAAWPSR